MKNINWWLLSLGFFLLAGAIVVIVIGDYKDNVMVTIAGFVLMWGSGYLMGAGIF